MFIVKSDDHQCILEYKTLDELPTFPYYPTKPFSIILDISVNGYLLKESVYHPFLKEFGKSFNKFMSNRYYKTKLSYDKDGHSIVLQCTCKIKNESSMKLRFVVNEFEGTILKFNIRSNSTISFPGIKKSLNLLLSRWIILEDYFYPLIYSVKARQQLKECIDLSNNFLRDSYNLPTLFGNYYADTINSDNGNETQTTGTQAIGTQAIGTQNSEEVEEDYYVAEIFVEEDIFDGDETDNGISMDDDEDDADSERGAEVPNDAKIVHLGQDRNLSLQDVQTNYAIIINQLQEIAIYVDSNPQSLAEEFIFGRSLLKDVVENHQSSGCLINSIKTHRIFIAAQTAAKMKLLIVLE
ncbi:uncharacterized protein KGF55_004760 [Candida pseudojiufengensis]|uniref:uncharacterized protein n=1 Tax=Candida pseudojiufengensis TaxID=497109 RepID=UPI00222476B8|nr:uncharacterized protein KGF55_004760 [Candida pseudojiufengensis]KAI5960467.1 hypothetical protein KGF55_004760 [Candida pseudojiufengensis]